jgi:nicotinate phosphoribosyltransferase
VYDAPPIEAVRRRAAEQMAGFHAGVKRFMNPHQYPVGLEQRLSDLKTRLVLRARSADGGTPPPVPSPLAQHFRSAP